MFEDSEFPSKTKDNPLQNGPGLQHWLFSVASSPTPCSLRGDGWPDLLEGEPEPGEPREPAPEPTEPTEPGWEELLVRLQAGVGFGGWEMKKWTLDDGQALDRSVEQLKGGSRFER